MENVGTILGKRKLQQKSGSRPINERWEKAKEFGEYVGIPTLVVLRLFRLYGEGFVLSIRSWLQDIPFDPKRGGKIALANWRLKELAKANLGSKLPLDKAL